MKKKKIVAIGGRNGPLLIGKALKGEEDLDISLVVSTLDSGRSTGVIRDIFHIPAPGDIRSSFSEFATKNKKLAKFLEYRARVKNSQLEGIAFGNLLIGYLSDKYKDFSSGLEFLNQLFKPRINILPVTTKSTHLWAELVDGTILKGEVNVRKPGMKAKKHLYCQPKVKASPHVLIAIKEADLIIFGPGGLYCSLIACLVVGGMKKAISESKAKKVYIANTSTQTGQTDNFSHYDHIKILLKYLGRKNLDYVIINSNRLTDKQLKVLKKEKLVSLSLGVTEKQKIKNLKIKLILADLIESEKETLKRGLWNKQNAIYHQAEKLKLILRSILDSF